MAPNLIPRLEKELEKLDVAGLRKSERILKSAQSAKIETQGTGELLNFCSNNYLGFASNAQLVSSAKLALEKYGYGLASVRFICGTQDVHKSLEAALSNFLGTEDTILYPSCFDANTGLFETLLGENDAIISDELNHASIIDGVRLCKAKRYRYRNGDMSDLEAQLRLAEGADVRMIATDGVFSMDGTIADLKAICDLAVAYDAVVMVDDSHAVGVLGSNGRGTPEYCGVEGRVDIYTGTLGKAIGGASGGYTSANAAIVEWLRQRSRPYLFSNTLAPVFAAGSTTALQMVENGQNYRKRLLENANLFRSEMTRLGFELEGAGHPIIPVMIGNAKVAAEFAQALLEKGIFVIAFSYPVVPLNKARIRTQISAAHSPKDIWTAINAFEESGTELGII